MAEIQGQMTETIFTLFLGHGGLFYEYNYRTEENRREENRDQNRTEKDRTGLKKLSENT